jgi:hypothetical protein
MRRRWRALAVTATALAAVGEQAATAIRGLVRDSYRVVAPKKLTASLE